MKLSVSSTLRNRVRILGVTGTRPREWFPAVINPSYKTVWPKFLQTKVAKELYASSDVMLTRKFLMSASFVSYISSIDPDDCWADVSVNIAELNMISVSEYYSRIREILHRKGLSSLIKAKSVNDVQFNDVDFIRAASSIRYTGYSVYTPKGKQTLDSFLHTLVPTTFKHYPVEFEKSPTLETLLQSNRDWYHLYSDKNIDISLGKANLNRLVVKYEIRTPSVVFYGNNNTSTATKFLDKFKEAI